MHLASGYTNTSRVIFIGPCTVNNVHLAADGANADCQVYDGLNAQGKLKAHIESLSGTSFDWDPHEGIEFHLGIYIVVNAVTSKVTVTYKPLPRHDPSDDEHKH